MRVDDRSGEGSDGKPSIDLSCFSAWTPLMKMSRSRARRALPQRGKDMSYGAESKLKGYWRSGVLLYWLSVVRNYE